MNLIKKVVRYLVLCLILLMFYNTDAYAVGYKTYGTNYFSADYSSGHLLDVKPSRVSNSNKIKTKLGYQINSKLLGDDGVYGPNPNKNNKNDDHDWAGISFYTYNNTTIQEDVYIEFDDAVEYIDSNGNPQYLKLRVYPVAGNSGKPWAMSTTTMSVWHLFYDEQYTGIQYRFYNSAGTEVGFKGIITAGDIDTNEGVIYKNDSVIKNFYTSSPKALNIVKVGNSSKKSNTNNPFRNLVDWVADSNNKALYPYFFSEYDSDDTMPKPGSTTGETIEVTSSMQKIWMEVDTTTSSRFEFGYATLNGRRATSLYNSDITINYYVNGAHKRSYSCVPYSKFRLLSTDTYAEAGYTFDAWYNSTNVKLSAIETCEGGNVNIYGYKTPNSYNLVINPNGGKMVDWNNGTWTSNTLTKKFTYTQTMPFCIYYKHSLFENTNYDKNYQVIGIPYKDYYEFGGWSLDIKYKGKINYGNTFSDNYLSYNYSGENIGDVEVKAIWIPVYKITLYNNGATTAGTLHYYEKYGHGNFSFYDDIGSGVCSYRCKNAISKITVPTKTGYIFGGYYNSDYSTQYVTADGTIPSNITFKSDTVLYAKWTPITYKILYNKGSTNS